MIKRTATSLIAASAIMVAGFANASPLTSFSVTADGSGGANPDVMRFTVTFDTTPRIDDNPFLDTLVLRMDDSTNSDGNDTFSNPVFIGATTVFGTGINASFSGEGTSTLTLDFDDLLFDAGESYTFDATLTNVCTNGDGASCNPDPFNSAAALANIEARMSGSFVSGDKRFASGGSFQQISDTTAVAAIPLPAAGWMLLAGLGGLAAMRRRQTS